ncbi:glucose sorbosone dehydrogenase [Haloferax elongans ATCC BAA-1513]|uniref:Glucose sorbosone dehydrogenase n=1 Tax=Haloferax elongans ATCC BAA-1513 TaxID=1230453 RepID=M0HLI5_HALEO|nr:PQQ-dependent sugar dehydrogenase [Haloferax elongans]ELZ84562.1 glucose sorbosone dehydrogenase [Haloferax elongans ATCC BAA-1513]
MDRRTYLRVGGLAMGTALAGCVGGVDTDSDTETASTATGHSESGTTERTDTMPADLTVERVATGLTYPWALESLPGDSRLLVTEKGGQLLLVDRGSGATTQVEGTPEVYARGQGGLLDVALHPQYPDEPWVYLTYSAARDDGTSSTHLGRGRLDVDAARITGFERLHAAEPFVDSTGHFGSRITFDSDERLYVSVGDRQFKNFGPDHVSQDRTNELGTILRFEADGSVPTDNPFVDDPDARDTIFSYGHRNPQGLATHPETGDIWETEFGEQDGDEINVLEAGANYGWPVADEGCTYGSGEPIGVSHADRDDVVGPVFSWPCGSGGFPPSGMAFYTGDAISEWQGDLFVAGLASQYLAHFTVDGQTVTEAEPLLADRGWRVRDVLSVSGSGDLYAVIDAKNAPLVRIGVDRE